MKKISLISLLFLATLFYGSCKSSKTEASGADKTVSVRIRSLENLKIQNPEATLTIYELGANSASNANGVIATKTVQITKFPLDVVFDLSDNTPKLSKDGFYYITLSGDANGNGMEDRGDLKFKVNEAGITPLDMNSTAQQVLFIETIN